MTIIADREVQVSNITQAAETFEQRRRLRPRLWDTDWLVLRGMRAEIETLASRICAPGKTVLDFGCGAKPYAPLFTSRGCTYNGADLGGVADIAIRAGGTLDAPDGSKDLVVSFQVLEHVRDLDTYLNEARRVLTGDGLLLLSTHGTWLYHPHPEDHRRWTREGLIGDLGARGFDVTDCIAVTGPLAWTTMIRLTCIAVAVRRVPVIGNALANAVAVVMNLKAALEDKMTPAWVTKDNACVYVTLSRVKGAANR
ncbi:MAG: class I SAM-dependent methyltransferase [Hyphomicrobiaceae bacterium]